MVRGRAWWHRACARPPPHPGCPSIPRAVTMRACNAGHNAWRLPHWPSSRPRLPAPLSPHPSLHPAHLSVPATCSTSRIGSQPGGAAAGPCCCWDVRGLPGACCCCCCCWRREEELPPPARAADEAGPPPRDCPWAPLPAPEPVAWGTGMPRAASFWATCGPGDARVEPGVNGRDEGHAGNAGTTGRPRPASAHARVPTCVRACVRARVAWRTQPGAQPGEPMLACACVPVRACQACVQPRAHPLMKSPHRVAAGAAAPWAPLSPSLQTHPPLANTPPSSPTPPIPPCPPAP